MSLALANAIVTTLLAGAAALLLFLRTRRKREETAMIPVHLDETWRQPGVTPKRWLECLKQYLQFKYGITHDYPPGLRLEMHPSVYQWIVMDPELLLDSIGAIGAKATLPVKVNYDLNQGAWRLVLVKEEELVTGNTEFTYTENRSHP